MRVVGGGGKHFCLKKQNTQATFLQFIFATMAWFSSSSDNDDDNESELGSISGDTPSFVFTTWELVEHIEANARVADPDGYGSEHAFVSVKDSAMIHRVEAVKDAVSDSEDESSDSENDDGVTRITGYLVNWTDGGGWGQRYDPWDSKEFLFEHGKVYDSLDKAKAAVRAWLSRPLTSCEGSVDRRVVWLHGCPAY